MKIWITLTLISLANKRFEELNPKCGNLTVDILLHFQARNRRVYTSAKENLLQQLSLTIRKSSVRRKITISEQNFRIDIANGRLNAWFPENNPAIAFTIFTAEREGYCRGIDRNTVTYN
jgi:hypothetical protein